MNKYYVGSGTDLMFPERCEGPFANAEEAKEFLRSFDKDYASPEMLKMTVVVFDDDKKKLSLYREDGEVVTLGSVV